MRLLFRVLEVLLGVLLLGVVWLMDYRLRRAERLAGVVID